MPRTQKLNRQYYLNRKVKRTCKVIASRRIMYVGAEAYGSMTEHDKRYMLELRDKYGYSIQSTL